MLHALVFQLSRRHTLQTHPLSFAESGLQLADVDVATFLSAFGLVSQQDRVDRSVGVMQKIPIKYIVLM